MSLISASLGHVGRIEFNLYGNVYLDRLLDEKRFKPSAYVDLLKADVPEQSLSVVEGFSNQQKKIIVDSLLTGGVKLNTIIKIKDEDYPMMRKFMMILLREVILALSDGRSLRFYKEIQRTE